MFASRNRTRIALLLCVATLNYWLAVSIAAVVTGLGIALWVIAQVGDLPSTVEGFEWLGIGLAGVVALSAVIGSLVALVRIPGQRRTLERRVMTETGARIATPEEHPRVRNLLEGLAIAADVPVPRFAVIDDPAPNSFGVGTRPSNTIIGVTTGLVERLSRDELEAVLAYEVSRIDGWDIALSSWTVALTAGAIGALENDDVMKLIGWLPVKLAERLQVWALRDQGELRDRYAVHFTRNPLALVRALEKLHDDPTVVQKVSRATAPLWVEFPTSLAEGVSSTKSGQRLAGEFLLDQRIDELRKFANMGPDPAPAPSG
jgi:heat shock protein HtpX